MSRTYLLACLDPTHTDGDALWTAAFGAAATAAEALAVATPALADAQQALATVPSPANGRTITTLQQAVDGNRLNAIDYGVVGDGATDDTAAMNVALAAAAVAGQLLYCGSLCIKISGALTMGGPGIVFDFVSQGANIGQPGIYLTGTGYTALTVTSPIVTDMLGCMYGTGQAVNGTSWGDSSSHNQVLATTRHWRVYNIAGFGQSFFNCVDCSWGTHTTEKCGNATNFSFGIFDGAGHCSGSSWATIQSDTATTKAMSISGNTANCRFGLISSVGAIPTIAVETWYLGGVDCAYGPTHLNSGGTSANATAHLGSTNSAWSNLVVDGNIVTELEGISGATLTLVAPDLNGTTTAFASQTGTVMSYGGQISRLATPAANFRLYGTNVGTLTVGVSTAATQMILTGSAVATLASSDSTSAATFVRCAIAAGTLLASNTVLDGSSFAAAVTPSGGTLTMLNGASLGSSLTYSGAFALRMTGRSKIVGTVTKSGGGNTDILADWGCTVGGSSANVGIPTGGAHVAGDFHANMLTVASGVPGWICVTAGTPGTFKTFATVSA